MTEFGDISTLARQLLYRSTELRYNVTIKTHAPEPATAEEVDETATESVEAELYEFDQSAELEELEELKELDEPDGSDEFDESEEDSTED